MNVTLKHRQFIPHALGKGDSQAMDGVTLVLFLKGMHCSEVDAGLWGRQDERIRPRERDDNDGMSWRNPCLCAHKHLILDGALTDERLGNGSH